MPCLCRGWRWDGSSSRTREVSWSGPIGRPPAGQNDRRQPSANDCECGDPVHRTVPRSRSPHTVLDHKLRWDQADDEKDPERDQDRIIQISRDRDDAGPNETVAGSHRRSGGQSGGRFVGSGSPSAVICRSPCSPKESGRAAQHFSLGACGAAGPFSLVISYERKPRCRSNTRRSEPGTP